MIVTQISSPQLSICLETVWKTFAKPIQRAPNSYRNCPGYFLPNSAD